MNESIRHQVKMLEAAASGMRYNLELLELQIEALRSRPDAAAPKPTVDPRYISKCRIGYGTILGYLAEFHPERLAMMDETPDATMRDGWALRGECCRRGLVPISVEACQFLKDHGITTVNSYPVWLLQARFD